MDGDCGRRRSQTFTVQSPEADANASLFTGLHAAEYTQ